MINTNPKWYHGLSTLSKLAIFTVVAVVAGSLLKAVFASPSSISQNNKSVAVGVTGVGDGNSEVITHEKDTKTESIPFEKIIENDNSLEKGRTSIKTKGIEGTKTLIYNVTFSNGKESGRELISTEITTQPVAEVTLMGTKEIQVYTPEPDNSSTEDSGSSGCDPNYSGACVPIDSDVDCAGGSGNGPSYVTGPVYVIGNDIYGLDRDKDGIGCE